MDIEIRHINIDNAAEMQAVYAIEDMCFPKEEQDSTETIYCRAKTCPDFFWVAADKGTGEIIGFFNGMPTEQEEYTEEVFTDFSLCKPEGPWVMGISIDIAPAYRKQDAARKLLEYALNELRQRGCFAGMVFICKEHRVPYFATFGAVDEGISDCRHGGTLWHQMRLMF